MNGYSLLYKISQLQSRKPAQLTGTLSYSNLILNAESRSTFQGGKIGQVVCGISYQSEQSRFEKGYAVVMTKRPPV